MERAAGRRDAEAGIHRFMHSIGPAEHASPHPSLLEMVTGFVSLGLRGFGGMAAHARYFFVVERKWLEEREFAELFGICQAIPGPNVVGMSIVLGDRAYGPFGSFVCASALCIPPTILAVFFAAVIQVVAHDPITIGIERGVVAGAGGLMIATGLRTLYGLTMARRRAQMLSPARLRPPPRRAHGSRRATPGSCRRDRRLLPRGPQDDSSTRPRTAPSSDRPHSLTALTPAYDTDTHSGCAARTRTQDPHTVKNRSDTEPFDLSMVGVPARPALSVRTTVDNSPHVGNDFICVSKNLL